MTFLKILYSGALFFLITACSSNNTSSSKHSISTDSISVRQDFNRYFKECHAQGSIVVYSTANQQWIVSDSMDAYKEALPASTFKIINLLIALETGVIKDENEIVKWVGQTDTTLYGYRPEIYRDMTVQEAFEESAGWVFIELSKRIGKDRYKRYLKASHYGNQDIDGAGADFWNLGRFGISPVNQVRFLKNVYEQKVPFSKRNLEILKKVMITEAKAGYTIRSKTGWTRENGINTGWWVGYLEKEEGTYFFATRLFQDRKLNRQDFGACRKEITRAVLKDLKALPQ